MSETKAGRDVRSGDQLADYILGGPFVVTRIDPEPHRTAARESARSAYDGAGRGLVVFCDDDYRLASR
jgi:hypothetical protein